MQAEEAVIDDDLDIDTTTVVYLLGETRLAINKNPLLDIKLGDRFSIFELTENILDPVTNEDLGQLRIYKGTGKVVDIQPTMAIVESDRESLLTPIAKMSIGTLFEKTPLMPFNKPKIGDFAVRIKSA